MSGSRLVASRLQVTISPSGLTPTSHVRALSPLESDDLRGKDDALADLKSQSVQAQTLSSGA